MWRKHSDLAQVARKYRGAWRAIYCRDAWADSLRARRCIGDQKSVGAGIYARMRSNSRTATCGEKKRGQEKSEIVSHIWAWG